MNKRQRLGAGYIFSRLALVFLLAATFFPLVMMVNMSLKPTVLISTDFLSLPADPYLQNFSKAFEFVKRPVLNSLYICALSLLGVLFNATLSGYAFARMHFRGKTALYSILVAVLMVPATITIVPQFIVISRMGLINTYWALLLPPLASTFGVFLMMQFMESAIPDAVLEAARIDGASEYRTFFSIAMPAVKPAWLTLVIFTFQSFWNVTGVSFVYDESLKTLPSVLSTISSGGLARAGATAAVAVIVLVPPIIIFIISQSSISETMAHSGLK